MTNITTSRRSLLLTAAALPLAGLTDFAGFAPRPAHAATGRAVVIYFSPTGTVEGLARTVAEAAGADLLRLELKVAYDTACETMLCGTAEEVRAGARRELAALPDLSRYETVFLGTRAWESGLPVPVGTFLADHPLAGKKIRPFIVTGQAAAPGAVAQIRARCPGATVGRHFEISASHADEAGSAVRRWVDASLG